MKSILNGQDSKMIIDRINSLKPDDQGLWGKLSVAGMVCHLADQIRMATGQLETRYVGNFLLKTVFKTLILWGFPTPKGKIQTTKELDQNRDGTKPTTLEPDKETLTELINGFEKAFGKNKKYRHPAFGWMDKKQWGRLVYIHLNYHLRQFGK